MKSTMRRISQLDGLRGILALWVVFYHMYGTLPIVKLTITKYLPFITQAWFTVDVFFVMSGFVMFYVYENTFTTGVNFKKYLNFMRARFSRLYPVHLFTMLLFLVPMSFFLLKDPEFFSWTGRYSIGTFLASLFFIQSPWFPIRSWNYPNWSISAEFHAYIIFPLLVPFLQKVKPSFSFLLILICQLVVVFLYYSNRGEIEQYPTNGFFVLFRVIPLFICGIFIFRLWRHDFQVHSLFWIATIFVLLLLLVNESVSYFSVLVIPILLITSLNCNLANKILTSRFALFLGSISYSLYMVHAFVEGIVIGGFERILRRVTVVSGYFSSAPLSFVLYFSGVLISVILAFFTFKYIELPARKFINSKLPSHEDK